jgi:hypothetical protein
MPDFFAHLTEVKQAKKAPAEPVIPDCLDCLAPANPAWRLNGVAYCANCAAPELKNPSKYLKEQDHGSAPHPR